MIDEKMQPHVDKIMRIQIDSTEQIMQQEQFKEFIQHFDPKLLILCVSWWSKTEKKNCVRVPFKILEHEHVVSHIHI